jgi:hypothetical protein
VAFTAGISAVPQHAKLLPLVFKGKHTSENTQNLLHAWGYYVVERDTSAPLLFAHSRSFPVMYAEAPPHRFNHLVLESFAPSMRTPEWLCGSWHTGGVVIDDCVRNYHDRWSEFWAAAEPRFDHVLMWDAAPEALAEVPSYYELVFRRDRLSIFARKGTNAMSQVQIDDMLNRTGNTPGNTPGNTLGNTLGNTPGNTPGNTLGNTPGSTGSRFGGTLGSTLGGSELGDDASAVDGETAIRKPSVISAPINGSVSGR